MIQWLIKKITESDSFKKRIRQLVIEEQEVLIQSIKSSSLIVQAYRSEVVENTNIVKELRKDFEEFSKESEKVAEQIARKIAQNSGGY